MSEKITIQSNRLGEITYDQNEVINMVRPVLGFNDLEGFLLVGGDETMPFYFFQSTEDEDISFVLVNPENISNDYKPDIPDEVYQDLEAKDKGDCFIFCVVVVAESYKESTVNLKAPIIINLTAKLALQHVLEGDTYDIKTPISLDDES